MARARMVGRSLQASFFAAFSIAVTGTGLCVWGLILDARLNVDGETRSVPFRGLQRTPESGRPVSCRVDYELPAPGAASSPRALSALAPSSTATSDEGVPPFWLFRLCGLDLPGTEYERLLRRGRVDVTYLPDAPWVNRPAAAGEPMVLWSWAAGLVVLDVLLFGTLLSLRTPRRRELRITDAVPATATEAPSLLGNRPRCYVLRDGKPMVEPDYAAWRRWFDSADRTLARSRWGEHEVVTAFLGIDDGSGLLFATTVFGPASSDLGRRYASQAEAERGHQEIVAGIKRR